MGEPLIEISNSFVSNEYSVFVHYKGNAWLVAIWSTKEQAESCVEKLQGFAKEHAANSLPKLEKRIEELESGLRSLISGCPGGLDTGMGCCNDCMRDAKIHALLGGQR